MTELLYKIAKLEGKIRSRDANIAALKEEIKGLHLYINRITGKKIFKAVPEISLELSDEADNVTRLYFYKCKICGGEYDKYDKAKECCR